PLSDSDPRVAPRTARFPHPYTRRVSNMEREKTPTSAGSSFPMSRRGLLTAAVAAAGATVAYPLLSGCSKGTTSGPGTTSQSEIFKIVPKYIQNTAVTADIPGVVGAAGAVSDPVFLQYPATPVVTVQGVPGKGGTYTTMTPLWGAIPASSGNAYYDAVNKALGVTLKIQPADGNTYGDKLPPLFASNELPDWMQI